jgi:HsdM N-terminal domain
MLTGELRNQIDGIWNDFWSGGLSNPLQVIEQITYLIFIKRLDTVERAVKPFRQELEAEARATVRFETPPGKQMQIDFGERLVEIGGAKLRAYLFVATLGYSRRCHVRAFRNERQESWFDGWKVRSRSLAG